MRLKVPKESTICNDCAGKHGVSVFRTNKMSVCVICGATRLCVIADRDQEVQR